MARTQQSLYAEIDLDLSWSERELPERERTKHVHRLHPYLGKFIPQLVEVLLERYVAPGGSVLDPFAGSGTTLRACELEGFDSIGIEKDPKWVEVARSRLGLFIDVEQPAAAAAEA